MNYKSQILLGAMILFLGSGAAYSKPCGECSSKNAAKCLKKIKECLGDFDQCGQAANTSDELDACDAKYQRCIFEAEKKASCPITRQSSPRK